LEHFLKTLKTSLKNKTRKKILKAFFYIVIFSSPGHQMVIVISFLIHT